MLLQLDLVVVSRVAQVARVILDLEVDGLHVVLEASGLGEELAALEALVLLDLVVPVLDVLCQVAGPARDVVAELALEPVVALALVPVGARKIQGVEK